MSAFREALKSFGRGEWVFRVSGSDVVEATERATPPCDGVGHQEKAPVTPRPHR